MDFQTLNRRELQALCKLNKIPANITNIAMADALSSLQTVEGIEEFLNPSRTETVGLSIKSPTWKKAKIDHNEVLKTPLVSCTRKKDPETSSCHLKECQHIAKKQFLVNHENSMPNTPVVYGQMKVTKSTHKETVQKETTVVETTFSARRSTRLALKRFQRAFVTSKEDLGKPLQEKHDVLVLAESDENSKIEKVVHEDTITLENGEKKVDCCGDVDNLKVKLEKIFGQLEDVDLEERQNDGKKFGQVDNLSLEGIHNPNEPSKFDNHKVSDGIEENISGNTVDFVKSMRFEDRGIEPQESLIEVEESEELLTHSGSETAGLSIETSERVEVNELMKTPLKSCTIEKALIPCSRHDVASQLVECEDIASLVSAKKSEMTDVMEVDTSEPVNIDSILDRVKDLDKSLRIEQVVHVDTIAIENGNEKVDCCNLNMKSVRILEQIENVDLEEDSEVDFVNPNKEGPLMEENDVDDAVEVTHDESIADVAFLEEENHQISTNENVDVIEENVNVNVKSKRELEVAVTEEDNEKEGKSSLHGNSLRQLKKRLKATLINSPISIRIKTEVSDNKENNGIEKPQVVVAEEDEKEKAKKSLNNNDSRSLRQLKKQLKSVKYKNEKVNIL